MTAVTTPTPMPKGEREDLQRLVRQREKVLKSAAEQRSSELIADFENQKEGRRRWGEQLTSTHIHWGSQRCVAVTLNCIRTTPHHPGSAWLTATTTRSAARDAREINKMTRPLAIMFGLYSSFTPLER